MMNVLKKTAIAAGVALAFSGAAHAGVASVNAVSITNTGSAGDAYVLGAISSTPTVLNVTIAGTPGGSFEEYANFTASGATPGAAVAFSLTTIFGGIANPEILGLTIELWDSVHPFGSGLIAIFPGNNVPASFLLTSGGTYHFDISGTFGPSATTGQYSLLMAATPVPEPETYAMMLAGLGLMGFVARRRRQQTTAA